MSLQIRTGFIEEFTDSLHTAIQQRVSKLKPFVNIATINGQYMYLDDIGPAALEKNNNAYANIVNQEIAYNRRRISSDRYIGNIFFDKNQMDKLMNDQSYMNKVIMQLAAASQRKIDEVLVEALSASVTDKDGNVTTFANDGGITVDATSGVTFENWIGAKQELEEIGFGIDEDSGLLFLGTPQERNVLESEIQVSSMDFKQSFGIGKDVKGNLISAKGVDFKIFSNNPQKGISPILNVTSAVRDCFFFNTKGVSGTEAALTLGIQKRGDYSFEVVEMKETKIETWMLKGQLKVGAVRNANAGVVKYQTTAS